MGKSKESKGRKVRIIGIFCGLFWGRVVSGTGGCREQKLAETGAPRRSTQLTGVIRAQRKNMSEAGRWLARASRAGVVHRGGGGVCVGAYGVCGEKRRRVSFLDGSGGTESRRWVKTYRQGFGQRITSTAEGNRWRTWLCCSSEVQISEKPGKTAAREARW